MIAAPPIPSARLDGVDKVTGAATYAADITRPGMLIGRALRSPYPHARILDVDLSRARALPGVHAALRGAELPAEYLVGRSMRDMPVLARDRVRFVGEKVAAVAAESAEIAEAALELIAVRYEELPAVFDPLEAMAPDAPLLHDPDWVRAHKTPAQRVADYPNSVSNTNSGASVAEIEAALAASECVFEHTFRTPIQHQAYLEPHCCTVEIDERGVTHVWASNKAPFLLLNYLRDGLGLQWDQLEIHMLPLGGDFGGKGSFMDIPLAYLLAKASGRPVRMQMSYGEELLAGNPRHASVVVVKSGFTRDGRLQARWLRAYYNSGGYAAFKPGPAASVGAGHAALGSYVVPIWRAESHMIYTNTVPCGHMRAPGRAQTTFAVECHTDLCARALGIDPLELRALNAEDEPRKMRTGEPGSRPKGREVLEAATEAIGWHEPRPEGVGRGITLVEVGNSMGDYTAEMFLEPSGQIVFQTPIAEQGAGMLTVFWQITADAWGVPLEQVRVDQQASHDFSYDRGVGGSRTTRIIGHMIELLSERLQRRLAEAVAAELGFDASAVVVDHDGVHTPDGRTFTVAEAAALVGEERRELLEYQPDPFDGVHAFAAIAAEVHLDRETGEVDVRKLTSAFEVGRVINPVMHRGQIQGGLMQGCGYALMEGLRYEDGHVTAANLHEYKIPCMADVPELEVILLPPDPTLGITPIGEGPNCAVAPAIANAVMEVVGHAVEIPITPEALRGE